MLTTATSTWAATVIGVGLAVLVVVLLRWSVLRSRRLDRERWADFERQFAEYVATARGGGQAPPQKDAPSARRPE